ncbi:MAG: hypothetical protein QF412_05780 [Planctomycetota bacterium]|nr:hypothetical protein [Planctomycetota bacterium]
MLSPVHPMPVRLGALVAAISLSLGAVSAQGSYKVFGKGCPGSRGLPTLAAVGDHKLGGYTTIRINNLLPKQPAALMFGISDKVFGKLRLPLDLGVIGMTGCKQWVSGESIIPSNTGSGLAASTYRYPLAGSLIGKSFFNQYLALDSGARGPTKVVASNAGKLVMGPACKDERVIKDSEKVSLKIPPNPKLGTPAILLTGTYTGTRQIKCCGGPTSPKTGCSFFGAGTVSGSTGAFDVKVPPDLAKQVSDKLCAEVKSATGGIVTCTLSINKLTVPSLKADGKASMSKDDCAKKFAYTGGGNMITPKIYSKVTAHFKIKILFTINFSADIDLEATPTGSWKIANNKISATGKIPSVKASKTFTIPLINYKITFSETFNTPTMSGTTDAVDLPPPPVECK